MIETKIISPIDYLYQHPSYFSYIHSLNSEWFMYPISNFCTPSFYSNFKSFFNIIWYNIKLFVNEISAKLLPLLYFIYNIFKLLKLEIISF